MYRALALKAIEHDLGFDDAEPELLELAERTRIALEPQLEGNLVLLDGVDVSRRVRDGDVTAAASRVSVHPQLRRGWWSSSGCWAMRRRGDGGPGHRDGGVSGCRGEDFSGCGAGGAREPAVSAGRAGAGCR